MLSSRGKAARQSSPQRTDVMGGGRHKERQDLQRGEPRPEAAIYQQGVGSLCHIRSVHTVMDNGKHG